MSDLPKCIEPWLTISTRHMNEREAEYFEKFGADGGTIASLHALAAYPEGVFCWLGDDELSDLDNPGEGILGVVAYMRKHELRYVRFDCDGEVLEEVPLHDW